MSNDLYVTFLEKCIGRSPDDCEIVALTGGEIVEAIWVLNDRFRPYLHKIATLPYESFFETEADEAIVNFVLNGDDWSGLSSQAWRILLERHQQAIVYFQLQADEPFVPIPEPLSPTRYLGAVLLFVLLEWKLPFPVADRSALAGPASKLPGNLTSH